MAGLDSAEARFGGHKRGRFTTPISPAGRVLCRRPTTTADPCRAQIRTPAAAGSAQARHQAASPCAAAGPPRCRASGSNPRMTIRSWDATTGPGPGLNAGHPFGVPRTSRFRQVVIHARPAGGLTARASGRPDISARVWVCEQVVLAVGGSDDLLDRRSVATT